MADRQSRGTAAAPVAAPLRVVETIAALLSAGLVVIGVLSIAVQLLAPKLGADTRFGSASGPGWSAVGAQLCVGALGQILTGVRARWARWVARPMLLRWAAAVLVCVAVAGVLYAVWWD